MQSLSFQSEPPFVDITGRRNAPRLRLSVPAKLVSVCETQDCLLIDVSQTGARIGLARPLAVNANGYLRAGPVEVFVTAVRTRSEEDGSRINGLEFDMRLSKPQVLALRAYAENYEIAEQRESLQQARSWVMGGT